MARYYEDARQLASMVTRWTQTLKGRRHRFGPAVRVVQGAQPERMVVNDLAGGRVDQSRRGPSQRDLAVDEARSRRTAVEQIPFPAHRAFDARKEPELDGPHETVELLAQLRP